MAKTNRKTGPESADASQRSQRKEVLPQAENREHTGMRIVPAMIPVAIAAVKNFLAVTANSPVTPPGKTAQRFLSAGDDDVKDRIICGVSERLLSAGRQ